MGRVIQSPSVNSVCSLTGDHHPPCSWCLLRVWLINHCPLSLSPAAFHSMSPHQGSNIPAWRQKCLGGCVRNLDKVSDIPLLPHPQIFLDKYLATSWVNHGKFSKSMVNLCCLFPVIIFPFLTTSDFRKDVLHDFPGGWSESEQLLISRLFLAFLKTVAVFGVFLAVRALSQSSESFKSGSEQPHNNISWLFQHTRMTPTLRAMFGFRLLRGPQFPALSDW